MIKQPILVRDRTAKLMYDALYALALYVSMMPELEVDIVDALHSAKRHDLAVELTVYILGKFGHAEAVKEPRFSKTRRRINRQKLKPPRGIPKSALGAIA